MKTVIEMARSVGARPQQNKNCDVEYLFEAEALERFAELVRADEREACAKVCHDASVPFPGELQSDAQWSALCLATAIRARSNNDH